MSNNKLEKYCVQDDEGFNIATFDSINVAKSMMMELVELGEHDELYLLEIKFVCHKEKSPVKMTKASEYRY